MLSDEQRAAYQRDGVIVVPEVFSPAEIDELRRVTDEFVRNSVSVADNDEIHDCKMDNGPMLVVPGSHKGRVYDHHGPDGRFCGAMDPASCDIDLSAALPCLGKAGSVTVHHVRAVHGSATNFSGKERRFLLFQYRAADAWPLLGFAAGIDKFNELLLDGDLTIGPRLAPVPVRLPLPPAEYQGSTSENHRASDRRYFATAATT